VRIIRRNCAFAEPAQGILPRSQTTSAPSSGLPMVRRTRIGALAGGSELPSETKEMPVVDVLQVLTTPDGIAALLQVVMIDLVLAGDNAIVIGLDGLRIEHSGYAPPRWNLYRPDS
jgi:hypothetical protein